MNTQTSFSRTSPRAGGPRTMHGKPHQINGYVLDRDSVITAHGQHKRCVVTAALDCSDITVRVDSVPGDEDLAWPTTEQVLAVARHPLARMHPKGARLELDQIHETDAHPRNKWFAFRVLSPS